MEYIYIVKNEAFPNTVKIGRTKNLSRRLDELNQIIPTQWHLVKSYQVENSAYVEKFIHDALVNTRLMTNREFFSTEGIDIIAAVDTLVEDADHFALKRKFKSVAKISSLDDLRIIIKEVRMAKNISQTEFSKQSGVSLATIARFENGSDTTASTLLKLLEVLDCDLRLGLFVDRNNKRRRATKIYNTKV